MPGYVVKEVLGMLFGIACVTPGQKSVPTGVLSITTDRIAKAAILQMIKKAGKPQVISVDRKTLIAGLYKKEKEAKK